MSLVRYAARTVFAGVGVRSLRGIQYLVSSGIEAWNQTVKWLRGVAAIGDLLPVKEEVH
jgi:hypothetical protein